MRPSVTPAVCTKRFERFDFFSIRRDGASASARTVN
jgi:hypothetical protein